LATRGPFFKPQAACSFGHECHECHEWPQAALTATLFLFVFIRAIRGRLFFATSGLFLSRKRLLTAALFLFVSVRAISG
jgi:hypothetical protein